MVRSVVRSVLARTPTARPAAIVESTPPDLIEEALMYATVHDVSGLAGPLDDPAPAVQSAVRAVGSPSGLLLGRGFGLADGTLVALWTTAGEARHAADPRRGLAGSTAGDMSLGSSQVYEITHRHDGDRSVEPRYLHLTRFGGPRGSDWVRAVDRADDERIWPAVRDLPGFAGSLTLQASDGERMVLVLADSVETLEEGTRRLLSTDLLPGEDPAHLTGPDRIDVARLVIADLPVEVSR